MNMLIMDLILDKAKEIGKHLITTNYNLELELTSLLNNIKYLIQFYLFLLNYYDTNDILLQSEV